MDRRTSLITAAAIAAVILAGGTAVAANIGVLGAASNDSIGQLTATGDIGTTVAPSTSASTSSAPSTSVVTTTPPTIEAVSAATSDAQGFQVEDAGTVTVRRSGSGIGLGEVAPSAGWTWSVVATSPSEFAVTFTSPTTTYVFTAQLAADGGVSARVDEVVVQPAPAVADPLPTISTNATGDDDHGSEQHDDGDDHEEHEGGEDDD